jgi:hypothetical protein
VLRRVVGIGIHADAEGAVNILAGREMITFLTVPLRCSLAFSPSVIIDISPVAEASHLVQSTGLAV